MFQELIIFTLLLGGTMSFAQFAEADLTEMPSTHVPKLISTAIDVEATAGEEVTFPCEVDDLGDFVLMWKREHNRMLFAGDLRIVRDERIKIEGTSLHVKNVLPKDSGEYTCQISTSPIIELSHSLDVLYPPHIRPRPKEGFITAKEGESVTLTCEATGNPVPTIAWKHAGRYYDSFEESNYVINNAQKNDSGEYECIADNSIGEPASATITVEIVSAPKVYTEPRDGLLVIKEGEPISIGCQATGDPLPVIAWKKPSGEKMMKASQENKVMIPEATRADAGTYECTANNSLGISTSALIRVQVLYPPTVKMSHTKIHARVGTNINVTCMVEGEPAPTVTWKKDDGQVIHSGDRYHLKVHGHTHSLVIHHLQEKDFTQYECSAGNSLSVATGHVIIIGAPQVPVFTSKPHSTQGTKYTVSWTVSSHTPIDEYSLMYRKKSENEEWEPKSVPANDMKDEEMHTQMFQLVDLQPATEYEAVVKAGNKFGWSEQSEPLVFRTKSEEMSVSSAEETSLNPANSDNMAATNEKQMGSLNKASSLHFSLMTLLVLVVCSQCWH